MGAPIVLVAAGTVFVRHSHYAGHATNALWLVEPEHRLLVAEAVDEPAPDTEVGTFPAGTELVFALDDDQLSTGPDANLANFGTGHDWQIGWDFVQCRSFVFAVDLPPTAIYSGPIILSSVSPCA